MNKEDKIELYINKGKYKKAYKKIYKGLLKGYPWSYRLLGDCYYNGYYVPKNFTQAFNNYEMAFSKLDEKAYVSLGKMYLKGEGCKRNIDKAFDLFLEANSLGVIDSYFYLGYCYLNGLSVNESSNEAEKYFFLGKEQHDNRCVYALANLYFKNNNISNNELKAISLLKEAAFLGNVQGS